MDPAELSLFAAPPMGEQERMVEAVLFASSEPVTLADLARRMPQGCDPAEALAHLSRRYEGRGVHLVQVGAAFAFRTAADLGHLMLKESVETGKTPADEMIDHYNGAWNGDLTRIYADYSY